MEKYTIGLGLLLSSVLLISSGISKAISDKLQFHYHKSIFKKYKPVFWNPQISWKNKWKNGDKKQGEKFFLSSTLLVFTTDAWHLFNLFSNFLLFTGALLLPFHPVSIIGYPVFFTSFHIFYTYIFNEKKTK